MLRVDSISWEQRFAELVEKNLFSPGSGFTMEDVQLE